MTQKEDKYAKRRKGRTNMLKGGRPPQRRTFGNSVIATDKLTSRHERY